MRRHITPFNVITLAIMAAAAVVLTIRFLYGLGSITNLDQSFPWGLWIGFDVMTGVAFAGGAYVLTFMVYILRMEQYRPIVRVTVLNAFLAYVFYAGALLLDLGRPWHVINPVIGYSFGFSSVLFLIAWHFMLYMFAAFLEFAPAVAEWLDLRRLHKLLERLLVGTVIFGVTLSTLHQSALGALFLVAESKVHPLWYNELIPVLFFVSSIFAGLTMVIFEGSITQRVFHDRVGPVLRERHHALVFNLARIAGGAMFVYLFLQVIAFVHAQNWVHIATGWGAWYLFEVVGLVAVPMVLLLVSARNRSMGLVRVAALLTMLGVVANRLNISVIAYKWYAPNHYVPSWMEFLVTAAVISAELWVFRWIVQRMPVLGFEPAWASHHTDVPPARALPGTV